MKFLLFLASLLLVVDSVMVVVNGKPDPSSKANQNPNATTWEKCVKYCSEEVTCLLAYDNEGKCEWFQHENITKVKQTTVLEEEKVAFKVNNFSTSSCPSGLNPPTFDNQDAHGVLLIPGEYDNPNRVNYTIKYTAGTWEFSYFEQYACPTDFFVLLQRENIQWCMSVEVSTDRPFTSFSYDAAVTTCDNQNGSVLTGATNAAEMEKIKTMLSNLLSWRAVPNESFALRLDGKRTSACQATPKTASCMTEQGFTFMDPNAQLDYYTWATNAGARTSSGDDCLVLKAELDKPMVVDVQSCTSYTQFPAYTVLCGVEAWNYRTGK